MYVSTVTSEPVPARRSTDGVAATRYPTPFTSSTRPSGPRPTGRPRRRAITRAPSRRHPRERRRHRVADSDREGVRLVGGGRLVGEREEHPHHALNLPLVRPSVAADGLLHPRGRVLGARDARGRGRDERGAPRLSDEERDAGVGTDEGLLQRDGVRLVLRNERADALEDPSEPKLGPLPCAGRPAPLGDCPDAPAAFVDDPVPARSCPWVDAEDFHVKRVRSLSDDSRVGEPHGSPTSPLLLRRSPTTGPGLAGGKAALRPHRSRAT